MPAIDFPPTALPGRSVLSVSGPDAKALLSRLITADVENLERNEATYAALLTPQGKMLFEFFAVSKFDSDGSVDVFLLECAKSQSAALQKRLEFYRLRANVLLGPLINVHGYASLDEPKIHAVKFRDPRSAEIGWRALVRMEEHFKIAEGYNGARIALGLTDSDADLGSGEFFPHEANLDQLHGVSFTKGCYVGQEVVSRMEHRGTARSRILPVSLDGAAPPKGSDIRAGEKSIGTMLSSEGDRALALIRLDRLAEASAPLLSEGVRVQVHKPSWARYDVPSAVEDS